MFTHLQLIPRLRISGTILPLTLCAFMSSTGQLYYHQKCDDDDDDDEDDCNENKCTV